MVVLKYSSSSQGIYLIQRSILDSTCYTRFTAHNALKLQKWCYRFVLLGGKKFICTPSPHARGGVLPPRVALMMHAPELRGYQPADLPVQPALHTALLAAEKKASLQTPCHHNHLHRCRLGSARLGDLLLNFQHCNHQPISMYPGTCDWVPLPSQP